MRVYPIDIAQAVVESYQILYLCIFLAHPFDHIAIAGTIDHHFGLDGHTPALGLEQHGIDVAARLDHIGCHTAVDDVDTCFVKHFCHDIFTCFGVGGGVVMVHQHAHLVEAVGYLVAHSEYGLHPFALLVHAVGVVEDEHQSTSP